MTEIPNASLAEISSTLTAHQKILILSHVRPDGDAIGSQIALGSSLAAMGKEVTLINQDGLPSNLAFLPNADWVKSPPSTPVGAELVVALDTGSKPRLGEDAIAAGAGAKLWINIDHHKSNPGYGDLNHIDSAAPATAEIIYRLLVENDMPLPAATRDAIYTGVSTDTGSFQYASTTVATHMMAADLISRGLDVAKINQEIYQSHPFRRIKLLGSLLNTLELKFDQRVAHWQLPLSVKQELNLAPEDSEDLIDHIRSIEGVLVALFFEELPDGLIRVSMRSKDPRIDACRVCSQFGGGGHALAAGIRMAGTLESVADQVLANIGEEFAALA